MKLSLTPSLIKAVSGNYQLYLGAILVEAWQRIVTLKKIAWGEFGLFLLLTLIFNMLLNSGLNMILDWFWKQSFLANNFYLLLRLAYSDLLWLLGILLIIYALKYIRNLDINIWLIVEMLKKGWQALVFVGTLYFLINWGLSYSNRLVLEKIVQALELQIQIAETLSLHSILSGLSLLGINFILSTLPYIYVTMVLAMAMVLILDKKLSISLSLRLAYCAINQRFIKNISLGLILALFFFIGHVIIEMLARVLLAVSPFSLTIVTLGIGFITSSIIALISAMQYRQIFCEGKPVFSKSNKYSLKIEKYYGRS